MVCAAGAPAGTPPDIIKRVHAEAVQALKTAEMKEKLAADGAEPVGSTPEELGALVKNEIEKWGKVARAARQFRTEGTCDYADDRQFQPDGAAR